MRSAPLAVFLSLLAAGAALAQEAEPAAPCCEGDDDCCASGDATDPDAASAPDAARIDLHGRRVIDLEGDLHTLGGRDAARPLAVVVLGTECPISNRALPELDALATEAAELGVDLFGVVAERFTTTAEARAHVAEYEVGFPVLFDASGILARALEPTRVPEAYLIGPDGRVLYRGAVDDEWVAPGRRRTHSRRDYLAEAVRAVAAGEAVATPRTEPVGCRFEAPPSLESVTYARDVAPVLAVHCAECHRPGAIAPFPLTSYEDAAERARFLADVTGSGLMPPWPPEAGHGEFLDERVLSPEELEVLVRWAEAGAPEGEADDLPTPPAFPEGWRLGEPDLVLEMSEAYTVAADGPDDFRCFVLPTGLTEDRQVVAFEFDPGAPTVVHHALFFLDDGGRGRRRAERADGPGYPGFGGIGFPPSGALGGWAPGAEPVQYPDGVARYLREGEDVVLQVHYHPSGKEEADRSRLALYFADQPDNTEVTGLILGTNAIDIPPGEAAYERRVDMTLPVPVELVGVVPHMHYLGQSMRVWAETPDGEEVPLVYVKHWDFNWQGQYLYRRPIRLEAGTTLHLRAVYDNSADNPFNPSYPPKRVTHGEQTTDEMCLCFFQITTDRPEDMLPLRVAMFEAFFPNSGRPPRGEAAPEGDPEAEEDAPDGAEPAD